MEFEAVLEQTIALLQRQGRISYGALKRRFQLDDAYLEDLKVELIEAQQLAHDENGRILVWAGETASQPLTRDVQDAQAVHPRVERRTPDAERRQLTVMFCDLVDSTHLANQLDPEDWREVVRAYQETAAVIIQRFDGHIAQYLGDGLLVYFGYPQAHEDDARRAVRTGLEVEALEPLNARLAQPYRVRLAVRIGIHTGLVVVGEMGGGRRQEQLALGDTPNVAARIQGLAAPDTVVISPATFRLVRGFFLYQDLGTHALKGLSTPVQVYRILEESLAQSRLDVLGATGLTPLVGRDSEVALLLERWGQSQDGAGQVVFLCGEAGIGKSRLVEVLREHVRSEGATRIVFRCSSYLTFRANFRGKMRIALSSWDEQKNHRNPRTSRRHTSHHRAPQENACGRMIGQPLPAQWQLAGLESRQDDGRLVGLYPLRGRPPALSCRAVGPSTPAHPESVSRQRGETTGSDR